LPRIAVSTGTIVAAKPLTTHAKARHVQA
jgi:hypothetical protein